MTAIGIDLGTTYSVIAHVDEYGRARVLPNREGTYSTPSIVYVEDGHAVVGQEAGEMQALGENAAFLFKRAMGDPHFMRHLDGRDYHAKALSTLVLRQLKEDAETALGRSVTHAVITVPADFRDGERRATMEAGKAAGLDVLAIVNEPTAAALAFGLDRTAANQKVLVYDLGGGTFDISLVHLVPDAVRVLATAGNHHLGGRDWDDRIANWLASCFEEEHGCDPFEDKVSAGDLLYRCEQAKRQLSKRNKVRISITHNSTKEAYELTRHHFETLTSDLMENTRQLTEQVLEMTGLTWESVDGVLLVGGSTHMPMVRTYVTEMSGKEPLRGTNADEAVALGAALHASTFSQKQETHTPRLGPAPPRVEDVMSHSLGMVSINKERDRFINSIIIPKNKPIPSSLHRPFSLRTRPGDDNELEVYILQGESSLPLENTVLGRYIFSGIPHSPQGYAELSIEYAYDTNGVVQVSATETQSGLTLVHRKEPVPDDLSWMAGPPDAVSSQLPQHLTVMLAVDLSGSMYGTPLTRAQEAARNFVGKLDMTRTSLGLMAFADKTRQGQILCQNATCLERGIHQWTQWMADSEVGVGNLGEPFSDARKALEGEEGERYLIVLTDGRWARRDESIRRAQKCHAAGIEIIALGFGDADPSFLKAIATSDTHALMTNLDNLGRDFGKIAQVLTSRGLNANSPGALNVFDGVAP